MGSRGGGGMLAAGQRRSFWTSWAAHSTIAIRHAATRICDIHGGPHCSPKCWGIASKYAAAHITPGPEGVAELATATSVQVHGIDLGAVVRVQSMSAIAGEEDYQACGLGVTQLCYYGVLPDVEVPDKISPEWCKGHFGKPNTPKGSRNLTMTTVHKVLHRPLLPYEATIVAANKGGQEWAVAGTIMFLASLNTGVAEWVVGGGMALCPLPEWPQKFKDKLSAVRRVGRLHNVAASSDEVLMLRKMTTTTHRNMESADVLEQKAVRFNGVNAHLAMRADGTFSRRAYLEASNAAMRHVARMVVSGAVGIAQENTIEEWWGSRLQWAPSGSTSESRRLRERLLQDSRLSAADRPGKKIAVQFLEDDHIHQVLRSPPVDVARFSTKHEPGAKNRALFASDDNNFFVASFASLGLERSMNVAGMVGKQTPKDVIEWLGADLYTGMREWWLSADYAAFNEGHERTDLARLNVHHACAWHELLRSTVGKEKAEAALWVAMAHLNGWMRLPTETIRALCGLFSGSRDTARDNTELHKVYSLVATWYIEHVVPEVRPKYEAECGDDEDAKFASWTGALIYYLVHVFSLHELKPAKQMAGRRHEFLQRVARPGKTPLRPLAPMFAQLASGNWYKDNYTWYNNAVNALSDMLWNMHVRGLRLDWARRLAVEQLDATMRVPLSTGEDGRISWRLLEWWAFRHGPNGHPLWEGTGGEHLEMPHISIKIVPYRGFPTHATNAWMGKLRKRFGNIMSKGLWEEYALATHQSGMDSLYVRNKAQMQKQEAARTWPKRYSTKEGIAWMYSPIPEPDVPRLVATAMNGAEERRPATYDEACARLNVDARFAEYAGGLGKIVLHTTQRMLRSFALPVATKMVPWELYRADDAITAWGRTAYSVAPREQLRPTEVPIASTAGIQEGTVIRVVHAVRGEHRHMYVAQNPGTLHLDKLLGRHRHGRELVTAAKNNAPGSIGMLGSALGAWLAEHRAHSVVTSLSPRLVVAALAAVGCTGTTAALRTPPELIRKRLYSLGWSDERIARMLRQHAESLRDCS
uniref:RNA-directed RNA polymerase n=1 Tax=Elkhorn sea moss toti-like virus TaxID=2933131 RepID=A0A9C7GX20_9VIRU|nr:RNA-dependent RNA polymerase [Elkhorn sea moss toti-like virus]CAI5383874.1 RNA-dependent RNA polymerase [Elkhorn sea moss toti-like virus]